MQAIDCAAQVASRLDNPSGKIRWEPPEDQGAQYTKISKPLGQPLARDSLGQPLGFRSSLFRRPNHDEDDQWPPRALARSQLHY